MSRSVVRRRDTRTGTYLFPIIRPGHRTLTIPFSRFRDGTFSERIRKVRVERGFTQTGLAKQAGLAENLLYRWERELHGASRRTLQRVSEVLGVSPSYLLTGREAVAAEPTEPGEAEAACAP